jgi:hypothetical protein
MWQMEDFIEEGNLLLLPNLSHVTSAFEKWIPWMKSVFAFDVHSNKWLLGRLSDWPRILRQIPLAVKLSIVGWKGLKMEQLVVLGPGTSSSSSSSSSRCAERINEHHDPSRINIKSFRLHSSDKWMII